MLHTQPTLNIRIANPIFSYCPSNIIAVPANSTADLVAVKPDVSYTVGVHADVEENTEINLTIWETC